MDVDLAPARLALAPARVTLAPASVAPRTRECHPRTRECRHRTLLPRSSLSACARERASANPYGAPENRLDPRPSAPPPARAAMPKHLPRFSSGHTDSHCRLARCPSAQLPAQDLPAVDPHHECRPAHQHASRLALESVGARTSVRHPRTSKHRPRTLERRPLAPARVAFAPTDVARSHQQSSPSHPHASPSHPRVSPSHPAASTVAFRLCARARQRESVWRSGKPP